MKFSRLYPLNRQSIQDNVPAAAGLYRLSAAGEIFYIGRSQNLRDRLLYHLNHGRTNWIEALYRWNKPCFYSFAKARAGTDLKWAERDEIRLHDPRANIDAWTCDERAGRLFLLEKEANVTNHARACYLANKLLSTIYKAPKSENTQGPRFIVFDQCTLIVRDKELRCVVNDKVRDTDIVIANVTRADAAKPLRSPFWLRINKKIQQLQKEGKL